MKCKTHHPPNFTLNVHHIEYSFSISKSWNGFGRKTSQSYCQLYCLDIENKPYEQMKTTRSSVQRTIIMFAFVDSIINNILDMIWLLLWFYLKLKSPEITIIICVQTLLLFFFFSLKSLISLIYSNEVSLYYLMS